MSAGAQCNAPSAARTITTVVIGAGHAGLAISHYLREHGVEHVVLERGEVANSWRRERWDSLRLLTPNWQLRLPGMHYQGAKPDDFMAMAELVDFIQGYAQAQSAPVETHTRVTSVTRQGFDYCVETDRPRATGSDERVE